MDSCKVAGTGENHCSLHSLHHHHNHHHHHHHHHFFYIAPHCPFHRSILQTNNHLPSCSFSTFQNPDPVASADLGPPETLDNVSMVVDEIPELEEDEDPVLVLTDEWRDFFAKSEAKRKLAKKQVKKKGKI